jgi:hypothetical protein
MLAIGVSTLYWAFLQMTSINLFVIYDIAKC